ncbi:MAG: VWA domain-containing protein [Rhodospirillaceae bacterium]|nr:VWA domain-containing protein [Rhodospirillaceae bacterium]
MNFLSAELLWLLLLVPALPALYVLALRRRKPDALRFPDMDLIKQAAAGRKAWRRHVPPALLFLALIVMFLAVARPSAILTLPSERAVVVLAIDVSGSMRAADVPPNRMTVAKEAARAFVAEQPRTTRVGLVAFSTSAMIAQDPTIVRDDVLAAIDNLRPQRFTAVGSGLVASLQAIFPDDPLDLSRLSSARTELQPAPLGAPKVKEAEPEFQPVPPGSNTSAVIVLLSDGRTNVGVEPLDAARLAADRGIRVFTVGFGTAEGGNVDFGGGWMRTQLDEETLKAIAEMTGGKYFNAKTEADLKSAYETLTTQFVAETKRTEVTAFGAALALVLFVLAVGLSLVWSRR